MRAPMRPTAGTPARSACLALSAELWAQIKNEDWAYVRRSGRESTRCGISTSIIAVCAAAALPASAFNAPAAVGAALAHRKYGRLCVHIQNDGDLMYAPGVLWTAAHHRIPLLAVMHNNRAYHQEVMHIQRMADRHERGITRAGIGTTLTDPNIDLRQAGAEHGRVRRRPDQRSQGPRPGDQARRGGRQAR